MIHWALFSTLATGLFYGLYCLLLRRDCWLQLSRAFLLTTLAFSLLYPIIQLPEMRLPTFDDGLMSDKLFAADSQIVDALPVAGQTDTSRHTLVAINVMTFIYLLGVALTVSVLLVQVVRTAVAIRRMPDQDNHLHLIDDDTPPHSFFSHIVIGTHNLDNEQLQCILVHERLHVRQRHTLDLLAMRMMCCAAWFNPFAWLYVRELKAVQEYLADRAVLAAHGREGYLGLLYREATGLGYGHITNNFQSINIKKRIKMMNKKKSRFGAWKVLVTLPVAAMLMLVGCKQSTKQLDEAVPTVGQETEITDITTVDVDPEYPEGIEAMYKYLAESIRYPEQAKKDGVQGRIIVCFVVEADGSITGAEVMRGIGGGCDEEALRVVQAMPRWKPATQDGKPVRVKYNLPIYFKLDGQNGK